VGSLWFAFPRPKGDKGGGLCVDQFRSGFFLLFSQKISPPQNVPPPSFFHCSLVFIGEVLLGFKLVPQLFFFFFFKF